MRQRWYQRYLWPRILFWTSLVVLVIGLMIVLIPGDGTTREELDAARGGGFIALIALAGLLGGKYWMDYVARTRNVVACPRCGAMQRSDVTFCASCGTQMRAAATPESPMRSAAACPRCGATQPPDAEFCGACGTHLRSTATAAAPPTS